MRLCCYVAAAVLACPAGAAIAQDFQGEYCAGVGAFDKQANSRLLDVSRLARAGYADEMACQDLITQCLNASMSNNNPEEAARQYCTSQAEQMYPICAQVAATCGTQ
jgi:hypothetical protein